MQVMVLWFHHPFDFLLLAIQINLSTRWHCRAQAKALLKLEKWVSVVDCFRSLVEPSRDVVVAYHRWLWSLIIWHGNPVGSSVTALIFRDIRLLDQMSPKMLWGLNIIAYYIRIFFFSSLGRLEVSREQLLLILFLLWPPQRQGKGLLVASQIR